MQLLELVVLQHLTIYLQKFFLETNFFLSSLHPSLWLKALQSKPNSVFPVFFFSHDGVKTKLNKNIKLNNSFGVPCFLFIP